MNKVNDSNEMTYAGSHKTAVLAELIGDILGSPAAGKQIMHELIPAEEEATARNITDRLRLALGTSIHRIPGATAKQTQRLQAAWQLTKQLYFAELQEGKIVDDPSIAAKAFQSISWQPMEQFTVLSLDCKNRILSCTTISSGTATETLAHPRDVFSGVLRADGVRCIVAHNHPSGALEASPEDVALTRQLLECGKVLGIPLVDHLIVSRGKFASMRQTTTLWTEAYL